MLLASEIILRASQMWTESRLGHFREDFEARDDATWLDWIDVSENGDAPTLTRTPVPTPLVKVTDPLQT